MLRWDDEHDEAEEEQHKKKKRRKLRIKKNLDIMENKKNEMKSSQQVHFYRHQPNVLFFPFHVYIFSPSFFILLSHDRHIHSQSLAELYVSVSAERL